MKAAFVVPNLNVGGLERQWSILVPGLVERGMPTELFTLDGEGRFFEELVSQGIRAECLELHGRLNVVGAMAAARTVASAVSSQAEGRKRRKSRRSIQCPNTRARCGAG